MKIAIGADHRGFDQKEFLKRQLYLPGTHIAWHDVGTGSKERTDYPPFARAVCTQIQAEEADCGILLCGSGVGMSIAANRFAGIHAALVWNDILATAAKQDDNANVLVIPSDFIEDEMLIAAVQAWLLAEFKGDRYQKRIEMIDSWGGIKI